MEIIVCLKWSPDTSEADLAIAGDAKDIKKDDLDYDLNDWDRFAVEEAVRIKEKLGGRVTIVSVAPEEAEEMLRENLARGADEAFQIWEETLEGSDSFATAKILAAFVKQRSYDLILTGTLASDDCAAQVGGMLAAMLKIPSATLVSGIDFEGTKVKFKHELESGLYEAIEIDLPALLAVATGLNEPRFVSIRSVRKVAGVEIPTLVMADLGLDSSDFGIDGSRIQIESMALPPKEEGAEIIMGSPEEAAARLAEILKEKGGIS
jgi:electron transfer flavoprotein beta subunit